MPAEGLARPLTRWGSVPLRWKIAIALCLATVINYVDRAALSFAAPVMLPDLGLTTTQYGLVAAGFFWAYAVGQIISGRLVDRHGTRRAYAVAFLIWNIASVLHGLVKGFWSLLSVRVVLGLGEAANFPASVKAIAEWFPVKERSMATGVLLVGPGLGAVITPLLITWLILTVGWRWALVISGSLGFIWLWMWYRLYHPVETHPRLSAEERELILSSRGSDSDAVAGPLPPLASFLRVKEVWGLMLSRFSCDGAFYFFLTFLPLYFSTQRGLNLAEIALASVVPWVFADLGGLAGGWLGKRMIERGASVGTARRVVIWLGALLVLPATIGAFMTSSIVLAVALISLALFGIQMKGSSLLVMPADLFKPRDVASIWGLFGALGSVGGALFQAYAGWLIDQKSWGLVFAIVASMHIVSAAIVQVMIPRVQPLRY